MAESGGGNSVSALIGRPLARAELRDGRFVLALAGILIIVASYALPMFTHRIVSARTAFSGGTVHVASFPGLIAGQHYAQRAHPTNEELSGLSITTAPVEYGYGSGYDWLVAMAGSRQTLGHFFTFVLCLALPLLASALTATFIATSWSSAQGLRESYIPWCIRLAVLAVLGVILAALHQIDFSHWLWLLDRTALTPSAGFWGALFGSLSLLAALLLLRRETHRAVSNWWVLVAVVALTAWLLIRFKPYPYLEIWQFVQDGIVVTLRIVTTSFGFILLVSLLGGLGRISRSRVVYGAASLYVELVRGIPLLVQLLFIWFALPQVFDVFGNLLMGLWPKLGVALVALRLSPFTAAVVGLTICYGAYGSEIFRAGISSIHHGQMEAARSLGMTYFQAMRHIVLPQAVRVILPPIGNEFVALLKDSSLVSVLAVSDLTRRGREYMARTFLSFDTWILVALCYLVLTLFSSRAVEFIESKTRFER